MVPEPNLKGQQPFFLHLHHKDFEKRFKIFSYQIEWGKFPTDSSANVLSKYRNDTFVSPEVVPSGQWNHSTIELFSELFSLAIFLFYF